MVLFLEIVMATATVVMAIATFFMWRSSSAMTVVARNIEKIFEDEQQLNNQPVLMISSFARNSRKSEFRIRVKNIGKGPAKSVLVQVGNSDWHSPERVLAFRESMVSGGLGPGDEDEWSIPESEAQIKDGRLWVGVLYEGILLPPGAANFGTWGSVQTMSATFDV
ncbi:MAG: hypothetical protein OYH76_00015 [Defluviicoccus sp.]|nr:hypothetical protein [Defluviicoccus sp.]MDE0274247.1 hypothetical protein [Defluviicoccus sp.]